MLATLTTPVEVYPCFHTLSNAAAVNDRYPSVASTLDCEVVQLWECLDVLSPSLLGLQLAMCLISRIDVRTLFGLSPARGNNSLVSHLEGNEIYV